MAVMLDFLWHMRGSIALDGLVTNDEVFERIERLLAKQGKPVSIRDPGHVAFNAPLWNDPFQPNWLAMIIYNSGRFWIDCGQEGRRLRYDLSSLHGFVFCLIASLFFFGIGSTNGGIGEGIKFGFLTFSWLYGMNIVFALLRVPGAIRRAVERPRPAPHSPGSPRPAP